MNQTFQLDRKTWLRGEGDKSRLLRKRDKKMCCVGQYLKACGAEGLEEVGSAAEVVRDGEFIPAEWLLRWYGESVYNSDIAGRLYAANDDPDISEFQRELEITKYFSQAGISVEFVN